MASSRWLGPPYDLLSCSLQHLPSKELFFWAKFRFQHNFSESETSGAIQFCDSRFSILVTSHVQVYIWVTCGALKPFNTRPAQIQCTLRRGEDMGRVAQQRSYLQLEIPAGKGKCQGVAGQHKMNSVVFLWTFCFPLLCFGFPPPYWSFVCFDFRLWAAGGVVFLIFCFVF